MDVKNVRKWCRKFLSGRSNVHDEEKIGRQAHSDETVQAVEVNLLKNRLITVKNLEEKLGEECVTETQFAQF